MTTRNPAASLRARLLNTARADGVGFQLLLTRYGLERLLYRLGSRQPDPATKQPDPAKVTAFNDANPEVLLQARHFASQPVAASFASVNEWGVHGFGFVNAKGERQFGKWIFEPVGGVQGLTDDDA